MATQASSYGRKHYSSKTGQTKERVSFSGSANSGKRYTNESAAYSETTLTSHLGCAVSTDYVCGHVLFRRCGLSELIPQHWRKIRRRNHHCLGR
ncbi:hypothetical protein IG631_10548 [Alternaria alternata]|nr:hypothetical protein IG631_10548 [Alternaria alternata]